MKVIFRDPETGKEIEKVLVYEIDDEGENLVEELTARAAFERLKELNCTLDTDLYELRMTAGYAAIGKSEQGANFQLFFRKIPDNGGFVVAAGLEQAIDYLQNLRFFGDDIDFLREKVGGFSEEMLRYLRRGFRFDCDIYAVPEGTLVFPNEPLIKVVGPIPASQYIESALLAILNHQSLIATKAARICLAAEGDPVVDFGLRRAHGLNAALWGARSCFIGGCVGTSNVKAAKKFGIPAVGTHAHSWVESCEDEEEAFENFARLFPQNCILLVDTYNTIEGVKKAVKVAKEYILPSGHKLLGIRLDSGDLAYLSKEARKILDEAGLREAKIVASNEIDEWIIADLKKQGAKIDLWGVGTRMITSYSTPALGGVYKLTAVDIGEEKMAPRIKISSNYEKITNPGLQRIVRFFGAEGKMLGDLLICEDEEIPRDKTVKAHHPLFPHIFKTYQPPYETRELLTPIFKKGKLVYQPPSLKEIQERTLESLDSLDESCKRFVNPHEYKVSLSEKLFALKLNLLLKHQ
ncbi:MAG: nicotinate phosphoribosyltransferase [bacterium]|nr:nicotinate phosphoribosyltransferase [bacterium]